VDETQAVGRRIREVRCWRGLTLREAADLAALSFSFWGQVERGEKPVANRATLEAMASALRVHPAELTGQPWASQDPAGAGAQAGLTAIETALERYELGLDPGGSVRAWPRIADDVERLCTTMRWTGDYAAQSQLAPVLIGELHCAYARSAYQRREVLLGLMNAYSSAMWTTKRLGARGLPGLAARAVRRCAETLDDPLWLGYAAWLRGRPTKTVGDQLFERPVILRHRQVRIIRAQTAPPKACGGPDASRPPRYTASLCTGGLRLREQ
jgi:transcriptional regulator with XRE-family HTH domain